MDIHLILWVMTQYYFAYFVLQRVLGLTMGSSSSWLASPFELPLSVGWLVGWNTFFSTQQWITFLSASLYHLWSSVVFCSSDCNSLGFSRVITTINKILALRYIIIQLQNAWLAVSNSSPMVHADGRGFPPVTGPYHDWPHPPPGSFNPLFILWVSSSFTPGDKCSSYQSYWCDECLGQVNSFSDCFLACPLREKNILLPQS